MDGKLKMGGAWIAKRYSQRKHKTKLEKEQKIHCKKSQGEIFSVKRQGKRYLKIFE